MMNKNEINIQAVLIFKRAATYIRAHGWQVAGMGKDGSPRCSMGALASAYPAKTWDQRLSDLMYKSLYKELDGLTLTEFNYKYRNGERVAQLFEDVARKLAANSKALAS
jgi:hypothetical protein